MKMSETIGDIGEFQLIDRIHNFLEKQGKQISAVTLGIGDDAASFQPGEGCEILVTCDAMIEGRHYLRKFITAVDLGRRAMVMNISDIGAMGGRPLYALISLGLPAETTVKDVEEMYLGFVKELEPFGASIIGGNITGTDGTSIIDITLIGEIEKGRAVRRSTAQVGDAILVTGYLGQAAAGLRLLLEAEDTGDILDHPLVRAYNRPSHRAREGYAIARSGYANSMIDISDGFLGDLGHICEMSRVGAEIIQENLPLNDSLREQSASFGGDIFDLVLGDSDDYELIITCAPEKVDPVRSVVVALNNNPVSEVGRIVEASKGMNLISKDGTSRRIKPSGWDHFKSTSSDPNSQ